jgi:lauroyl/myristoyl acyltransferase
MSAGLSEFTQLLFPDLVRNAPPELARRVILAACAFWFAANARERKRIESNVADLLGPGERTEAVKRQVLAHIPEHYFEKLLVANRPLAFVRSFIRERVRTGSLAALDDALRAGHGAIAVTTHWGAVELIPPVLVDRGYPLTVVLETRTPRLRKALERLVAGSDVELLISSRGDSVLDGIFASLRRGRVLLTQVDEVDSWRRRKSRTIRLFGKTLFFDHTLDFIAKHSLAPAVGLYCARTGGLYYDLRCEALAPDPLSVNVAVKALEHWERLILEAPEQWYQWLKWLSMKAPPSAA